MDSIEQLVNYLLMYWKSVSEASLGTKGALIFRYSKAYQFSF